MVGSNEVLSERELEILRLVATGAANKEIARQLVISPNTVKVHLRNIFAKIGVASRTEATLYAMRIGLIKPGPVGEPVEEPAEEDEPAAGSFSAGLPGIVLEGEPSGQTARAPYAGSRTALETATAPRWKTQYSVLLVFIAAALITLGVLGSRFLAPAPTPSPTVAAQSISTPSLTIKNWSELAALPSARKGMGVAEYQNSFYLIAGETASGIDGAVLSYDQAANAWKTLATKPTPVTDVQAVLLGEKIYVPGGRLVDGKSTNLLEVYNPRQDAWESKKPLPVAVSAYALASFEGRLYLFGGKNGDEYLSSVYMYDPQQDSWTTRADLSEPRAYASAVVGSGKILILGGYNGESALTLNEAYFPARDGGDESPWETLAPLPQGRYATSTARLAGMTYVVGGLSQGAAPAEPGGLTYVETSNEWAQFDGPPAPVGAYPVMLASGNFLYVFGGETAEGLSSSSYSYQALYTILVPLIVTDNEP